MESARRRRRFHQLVFSSCSIPVAGVVSGAKVEQRRFVQEYVQTVLCTGDSWNMVHLVVGSWLKADGSGSLLRHRRAWVPVLKFDGVSGDMLPRSVSFNGNGLSYGKLHWDPLVWGTNFRDSKFSV